MRCSDSRRPAIGAIIASWKTDGGGRSISTARRGGRRGEDNPFGLYLYVEDVDAVADRVRDRIIEDGAPHVKP
jgi:hypothetical protein